MPPPEMGSSEIAALVSVISGGLVGLAGTVFGYLGKRAEQDAKDVVTLTEQVDERDRRLDVVVRAYWDQRQAVTMGGRADLLVEPPPEMRRAVKP